MGPFDIKDKRDDVSMGLNAEANVNGGKTGKVTFGLN